MFSSNRALHSLTVANKMYEVALEKTNNEYYAKEMFNLGWLHDIGYQFTENNREHAHVGGEFLKSQGYKYWVEIYEHGVYKPDMNYSYEWFLLNSIDMQTDSKGNYIGYDGRLKDIGSRYFFNSDEYNNAEALIAYLKTNECNYKPFIK
jgi:hypothetical protein